MQQSSVFIVLNCDKETFNGRLSCTYDRAHRLCGYWEVGLVNLTKTDDTVYVLCDLIDYSYVNNLKFQLLDYFSHQSLQHIHCTKLVHKRFSTINIE